MYRNTNATLNMAKATSADSYALNCELASKPLCAMRSIDLYFESLLSASSSRFEENLMTASFYSSSSSAMLSYLLVALPMGPARVIIERMYLTLKSFVTTSLSKSNANCRQDNWFDVASFNT